MIDRPKEIIRPGLELNFILIFEVLEREATGRAYHGAFPIGPVSQFEFNLSVREEFPEVALVLVFYEEEMNSHFVHQKPFLLIFFLMFIDDVKLGRQ